MIRKNRPFPNPFVSGPVGRKRRIGYIVAGALWLILFSFLLSFITTEGRAMNSETTGVVTSWKENPTIKQRDVATCHVILQYDIAGKTYTNFPIADSSTECKYKVGDTVRIKYNSDNPNWYMLVDNNNAYVGIQILDYGIGIGLILLGVISGLYQLRGESTSLKQ
jgi:ribosomal protein S17